MKLTDKDRYTSSKPYTYSALCFAILYALYCFVISPLYIFLVNDIAFSEAVLPWIVELVGNVCELAAISVAYAVIAFCFYKFETIRSAPHILIFISATLLKYLTNTAVTWITYGCIPINWAWDIVDVMFYTVLELIPFVIVLIAVKGIMNKHRRSVINSDDANDSTSRRIYDKRDPLLRSCMVCAIITFIVKVAGLLINDVWGILFYGFPEGFVNILLMLLSYAINAIFGVVCYFVMYAALLNMSDKFQENDLI